eukprot:7385069-Prymnesium_polylepis.1
MERNGSLRPDERHNGQRVRRQRPTHRPDDTTPSKTTLDQHECIGPPPPDGPSPPTRWPPPRQRRPRQRQRRHPHAPRHRRYGFV